MTDLSIRETGDYEKLVKFFIENELEFTDEDAEEVPTDLEKCWEITADGTPDGELIGAFVLAKRQGEYICDGIAVDSRQRGRQIGKALLETGLEEAAKRGAGRLYLVARAPEFFRKNGFVSIPRNEAPNFFECLSCPQYGIKCHPEVMVKEI